MKEELVTASSFDDISTRRALADPMWTGQGGASLAREKLQKPGFILPSTLS